MNTPEIFLDASTLRGVRYILTVKNTRKYLTTGCTDADTKVCVLRRNEHGYYLPCLGHICYLTATGRFAVELWHDRSEKVVVSRQAILWFPED